MARYDERGRRRGQRNHDATPEPHDDGRPPRTDTRRRLGADGEERAARLLVERGYRILERNLRAGGVEIDLIAVRGRVLAIVEVKTSASNRMDELAETLGPRQRSRLARGAGAWLAGHGGAWARAGREVRFDLVTCRRSDSGEWHLEHWPGAFEAGD